MEEPENTQEPHPVAQVTDQDVTMEPGQLEEDNPLAALPSLPAEAHQEGPEPEFRRDLTDEWRMFLTTNPGYNVPGVARAADHAPDARALAGFLHAAELGPVGVPRRATIRWLTEVIVAERSVQAVSSLEALVPNARYPATLPIVPRMVSEFFLNTARELPSRVTDDGRRGIADLAHWAHALGDAEDLRIGLPDVGGQLPPGAANPTTGEPEELLDYEEE